MEFHKKEMYFLLRKNAWTGFEHSTLDIVDFSGHFPFQQYIPVEDPHSYFAATAAVYTDAVAAKKPE